MNLSKLLLAIKSLFISDYVRIGYGYLPLNKNYIIIYYNHKNKKVVITNIIDKQLEKPEFTDDTKYLISLDKEFIMLINKTNYSKSIYEPIVMRIKDLDHTTSEFDENHYRIPYGSTIERLNRYINNNFLKDDKS